MWLPPSSFPDDKFSANEDDLKNEDNLKYEEDLKIEDDLKNEVDLKNWPSPQFFFAPPPLPSP